LAGYTEGALLPIHVREHMHDGLPFVVRDYQREAAEVFYAGGDVRGGSGVIVLPCGAGKTVVGLAAMALLQRSTLVLTTSITRRQAMASRAAGQNRFDRRSNRGITRGRARTSEPVTLATYQILTHRADKKDEFPHFKIFDSRDWGLIIL